MSVPGEAADNEGTAPQMRRRRSVRSSHQSIEVL
jgi:hypothetical protein